MHFSVRSGPTSLRLHLYPTDGIQEVAPLSGRPWLDDCCLATAEKDEILSNLFSFLCLPPLSQDNYHQIGLSQVETLRVDQLGMLAQVCDLCSFGFSTND